MSDDYGLISRNRTPRFYTKDEVKPLTSSFVSRGSPDYPAGTFLTPLCLTSDQARQLLSAAWQGAELLYGTQATEVVAPLLQALEYVDDPTEAACMPDVYRYRIFECRLQESTDGVTWVDVANGDLSACIEDGRTPELRSVQNGDCINLQWRYTDEPASAWRALGTVCDGDDGREIELRSIVSPQDDDCRLIQWRYVGEPTWVELATVCDGESGQAGQSGTLLGLHVGLVLPYTGAGALPSGLLDCDGATYQRTAYPALYDALAPVYRPDADTFRVPDMRGRVPLGLGQREGTDFYGQSRPLYTIGENAGNDGAVLNFTNLPYFEVVTTVFRATPNDDTNYPGKGHFPENRTNSPNFRPVFFENLVPNSWTNNQGVSFPFPESQAMPSVFPWPELEQTGEYNLPFEVTPPSHVVRFVIVAALPEVPAGDDGKTPQMRSVQIDDDCRRIEWKYTDENAGAWRELTTICDGDDGVCPECEDDDVTPPPDDDDKPEDDPPGTPDGKTARCKAAHNISEHVEDVFQDLIRPIITGAAGIAVGILAKKLAVAIGIKTFGVGFALGVKLAKEIQNLTSEAAFDAAFPDSVFEDGVKCDVYCTIGADGQYTAAEFGELLPKLSQRGGSYEAIRLFFEAVGYQQLNWYATFTDSDPYTCEDCECGDDPCQLTAQTINFVGTQPDNFCFDAWNGVPSQFPANTPTGSVGGTVGAVRGDFGWRNMVFNGNTHTGIWRSFENPITITNAFAQATQRRRDGTAVNVNTRYLNIYVRVAGQTAWTQLVRAGHPLNVGPNTITASWNGSLVIDRLAVVGIVGGGYFWIEEVRYNE